MIETQAGFDNREEIMSVDGLDGVFVGISDLRLSMTGQGGFDASDDTVNAALGCYPGIGEKAWRGSWLVCRQHRLRARDDQPRLPVRQHHDRHRNPQQRLSELGRFRARGTDLGAATNQTLSRAVNLRRRIP